MSAFARRHRFAFSLVLPVALLAGCASQLDVRVAPAAPASARHEMTAGSLPQFAAPTPAAAPAPRVRTVELGRSRNGRPITMGLFGDGPEVVFIFGGIHGNEPLSAALAEQFAEHLAEHPDLCTGRTVAIVAAANPDGLAAGTRLNAAGVDVNRNFPAQNWRAARRRRSEHGLVAGSEPETAALVTIVERLRPARICAIHSITRGRQCNNFDGPAEALARAMHRHNSYPVRPNIGYPTPGSFGSWAGVDRRIPTVTLELPTGGSAAEAWRLNRAALEAFVRGR